MEPSMLILTRRVGERVFVGGEIIVTLTRLAGDHVRLGIEAPPEVAVDREEVLDRPVPDEVDAGAADRISVVVVRIRRHQARIGIAAPPGFLVDRAEVRGRAGSPEAAATGPACGRLVLSRKVGERIVMVPGGGSNRRGVDRSDLPRGRVAVPAPVVRPVTP